MSSQVIIHEALDIVAAKYGSQSYAPDGTEMVRWLPYHNQDHSMQVYTRAGIMARVLDLQDDEYVIARMAAAAHDIVQEGGRGVMEQASAEWLEQAQARHGYGAPARQAACLAILGTEFMAPAGQQITCMDFPSKSSERIAQAVACADMGGLYLPTGPLDSHRLYHEQRILADPSETAEPDLIQLPGYLAGMVTLADTFRFSHPAGERVFGAHRTLVVEYHGSILSAVQAGTIESWQQLQQADTAFCDSLLSGSR